jgi:peptidoglycan/xylan/chitin deacetylase (PgdA/CDA1 family)
LVAGRVGINNSNKKKRRLKLYALIVLLIIIGILFVKLLDGGINETGRNDINEENRIEDLPLLGNKDFGDIQTIIEYGDNVFVSAHYPSFGKDTIDKLSESLIRGYIEGYKNDLTEEVLVDPKHHYELNIDYETYGAPNDLVSIAFTITEDSSSFAHPDVGIITRTYDLANDSIIGLNDIMEGEYLEYIAQACENIFRTSKIYKKNMDSSIFKEGIYPSPENYANFIFIDDGIVFKFAKYQLFSGNFGMPVAEIPYVELKDYIKKEWLEFFVAEKDIAEEDSDFPDQDSKQQKEEIVLPERDIDPNKPMVALTYDDGPNKKTTTPILDALKEHGGVATFFILGNRVSNNSGLLIRMLEEGSEIGNHSYSHKELTKLSYNELMEQITNTQQAVIEVTGYEPRLLRPTYGSFNDRLKADANMPLILWSIDTLDWKSRNTKAITDHVLKNVSDGDIILMHDLYDSTVEASQILIPKLIDMGYQLVTVSELFEIKGTTLVNGQVYRK